MDQGEDTVCPLAAAAYAELDGLVVVVVVCVLDLLTAGATGL